MRLKTGNTLPASGAAEPISRVDPRRSGLIHRSLKTETSTCGVPCYPQPIHALWLGRSRFRPSWESTPHEGTCLGRSGRCVRGKPFDA